MLACRQRPQWVTDTLRTITPNNVGNMHQISFWASLVLHALEPNRITPTHLRHAIGETVYQEWLELDHLLVRLRESHPFRLRVLYGVPSHVDGQSARRCMDSLLPEVATRGVADFAEDGVVDVED